LRHVFGGDAHVRIADVVWRKPRAVIGLRSFTFVLWPCHADRRPTCAFDASRQEHLACARSHQIAGHHDRLKPRAALAIHRDARDVHGKPSRQCRQSRDIAASAGRIADDHINYVFHSDARSGNQCPDKRRGQVLKLDLPQRSTSAPNWGAFGRDDHRLVRVGQIREGQGEGPFL
jgi:hypothetical protein